MKSLIWSLLALVLTLSASVCQADFPDSNRPGAPAGIWPDITFVAAGDFKEYTRTIQQNRDDVRRELMREFADVVLPMVMSGADAREAATVVANILLMFDGMHEKHKRDAAVGLGKSLEAIFRAEFDQAFIDMGVSDALRRVEFVRNTGLKNAVRDARSAGKRLPQDAALTALATVDFFMYGSFTVQPRGRVTLTLTVEKYLTGQTRTFESTDLIDAAIRNLARQLFDFFQSNRFADWINPQPHLDWVPAPRSKPEAPAPVARMYCRGQNARLPYARELLLAEQGTIYVPGGIGPFNDGEIYAVADRQRWNEQHYLFVGQEDVTGGIVRSGAGQADGLKARYWCVRGSASDEVRFIEAIYDVWRKSKDADVRKALDYILVQIGDFGAQPWSAGSYADLDEAVDALKARDIIVNIPMNLRMGQL